jgi:phenylacetate-coenzyme A ligase PaaK-like adenylate-forming protein
LSQIQGLPDLCVTGSLPALSLLFQFEYSQWLPPGRLVALQLSQLDSLFRHGFTTVPLYRQRWRILL